MTLHKFRKIGLLIAYVISIYTFFPDDAYAMHIMEGFLPFNWAAFWWLAMIPFVILGVRSIKTSPSGEVESFLFAVQAAIRSVYYLGYTKGKYSASKKDQP